MNPDRSNNLSLKYKTFKALGCKDIGIGKFKFVAKTQFLSYENFLNIYNTACKQSVQQLQAKFVIIQSMGIFANRTHRSTNKGLFEITPTIPLTLCS